MLLSAHRKERDLLRRNQKIFQARMLREFVHLRESFFPRDLLIVTDSCELLGSEKKILNFALTEKIKHLHKIEHEFDRLGTLASTNIFIERVA